MVAQPEQPYNELDYVLGQMHEVSAKTEAEQYHTKVHLLRCLLGGGKDGSGLDPVIVLAAREPRDVDGLGKSIFKLIDQYTGDEDEGREGHPVMQTLEAAHPLLDIEDREVLNQIERAAAVVIHVSETRGL
jgi:hypothetical protein